MADRGGAIDTLLDLQVIQLERAQAIDRQELHRKTPTGTSVVVRNGIHKAQDLRIDVIRTLGREAVDRNVYVLIQRNGDTQVLEVLAKARTSTKA